MAAAALCGILDIVVRCLLVVTLAGCHLAFPLPEIQRSESCGPFGDPTEVMFGGDLVGPFTQFSVNGDGTRGFVRATRSNRTALVPIKLDGDTWVHDPVFEANLASLQDQERVMVGHISFENDLFAAQFVGNSLSSFRYRFLTMGPAANTWQPDPLTPVAFAPSEHVVPGGALQTGTIADRYEYVVTRHEPAAAGRPYIAVSVDPPANDLWRDEVVSGGVLSTAAINEVHDASQGVLAIGRRGVPAMIYAATIPGSMDSQLYIAEKRMARYELGIPIVEHSSADASEEEPWTSPDCTVLYYRRGDKIYRAALDPTL